VAEVHVEKIPVTSYKTVYEDRVEQVPVRVCRMQPVAETVRVARTVEKRVPVECTYYVPRVVCCPTVVDPCGVPVQCVPSPAITTVPSSQPPRASSEPTLAAPKKPSAADVQPALPPSAPGPAATEEPAVPAPKKASPDTSSPIKPATK
jgi:hypothetical protein